MGFGISLVEGVELWAMHFIVSLGLCAMPPLMGDASLRKLDYFLQHECAKQESLTEAEVTPSFYTQAMLCAQQIP